MRRELKIFFILPVILFFLFPGREVAKVIGKPPEKNVLKLEVGEELVYVVRYSVMRLGEVKVIITGKKEIEGKDYFSAIVYIDSYPGIPFVDLHQIYKTTMTPDYYSKYFEGIIMQDSVSHNTEYFFDYDKSKVRIHKWATNSDQNEIDSTCSVYKKYQDGLSIFYYARAHSREKKYEVIPTFVNEKKVTTEINFNTEREDESIDAVDYDIDCTHLEGTVNFVSVFGLTGDFEGWFSNDDEAIPIKAKMNVIIGSITIELKSWKRTGWEPPRYTK